MLRLPFAVAPDTAARDLGTRDVGTREAAARDVDARLIAKLDQLLVALHSAGRHAISILDTGCGESEVLFSLVTRAPRIGFTAVDVVGLQRHANCPREEGLSAAAGHSSALRVTLTQPDDHGRLPFKDGEFDIVILVEDASRRLVKECERVTCKGGVLVPRY